MYVCMYVYIHILYLSYMIVYCILVITCTVLTRFMFHFIIIKYYRRKQTAKLYNIL